MNQTINLSFGSFCTITCAVWIGVQLASWKTSEQAILDCQLDSDKFHITLEASNRFAIDCMKTKGFVYTPQANLEIQGKTVHEGCDVKDSDQEFNPCPQWQQNYTGKFEAEINKMFATAYAWLTTAIRHP